MINLPPFNLPEGLEIANGPIRAAAVRTLLRQLPTVEFMTSELFVSACEQTILCHRQDAVAHLQSSFSGVKRQEPRHWMGLAAVIGKALTQKQHASAFGIDRSSAKPLLQADQALITVAQCTGVELREASGQDQPARLIRNGLVRQRSPRQHRHGEAVQPVLHFRVTEVEGLILCNCDRNARQPLHARAGCKPLLERVLSCLRTPHQRQQSFEIEMLFSQGCPGLQSFGELAQLLSGSEAEVPAG